MAPSRKKVLVRLLAGAVVPGYLPPVGLCVVGSGAPALDLLDLSGRTQPILLADVRFVAYVREFNLVEPDDPEQLSRRLFLARPRSEGLWVRLTFCSGDVLEGLCPADLSLADALIDDAGLFLSPPDPHSNTHRLFVPRSALGRLDLLAVIASHSKTKTPPAKPHNLQTSLFPPS